MDVLIVVGSIVFAAGFALVWLLWPDARAWLERPKHRFRAAIRQYDRDAGTSRRGNG